MSVNEHRHANSRHMLACCPPAGFAKVAAAVLPAARQWHAPVRWSLSGAAHTPWVCMCAAVTADCCFIEDTAVVVGKTAIIALPGAAARQGEQGPVAEVLQGLGCDIKHLQPQALLDGGDVLQLPRSEQIIVGLSNRTNAAAVEQMQRYLPGHQAHGVHVAHGLHLKSAVTALDHETLLFADSEAGRQLSTALSEYPALNQGKVWQHMMVPDPVCANVLLVEENVVMQRSDPQTEQFFESLCAERGLQLHKLPRMEELIKADGALTCCSILLQ